ncbi:MAG: phosphoribosylanthranilate isomerase [Candidatus Adiutrix sp.]
MVLVKVCGLTCPFEAIEIAALGADFLGFIFHANSPRFISPRKVGQINPKGAHKVGVFVNHKPAEIREIMTIARLQWVQLHGGQDINFCQKIGPKRVIKVLWPENYHSCDELSKEMNNFAPYVAYFLLDAGRLSGGHGQPFDWEIIKTLCPPKPFFLAGGLTWQNAPKALKIKNLAGLDFNSGLEISPGKKDINSVKTLFKVLGLCAPSVSKIKPQEMPVKTSKERGIEE